LKTKGHPATAVVSLNKHP